MQGLRGRAGQAVIAAEHPQQHFLVAESTVVQHSDQSGQRLDDSAVIVEEDLGNAWHTIATNGEQLVVAQQLLHSGDRHA